VEIDQVELAAGMSIREILAIAFREKRKIMLAAVIPPAISVAMLFVLTPVYRAETALVIKTGHEYIAASQGQSSALGPSSTLQEEVNTEIQIMTSRGVMEKVANKIGLANIYPDMSANMFGPGGTNDAAIDRLIRSLDVEPVKLSNVLSVTFDSEDPKIATRVLSEIVDAYQAAHLEVYAGNRARVYKEGIQRGIEELDQLEHDRSKIKVDNQVYDIALQRASLIAQRSDAESHLQDAQTRMVTLQKRLSSLRSSRGGIKNDVTSADTAKNELEYSQNALTDLHRNELALLARFSADNPQVNQVREQIRGVERRIAELNASLVGTKSDPVTLSSQIDQQILVDQTENAPLQAEIGEYVAQVAKISDELQRIEKVDTDLRMMTERIEAVNTDLKMARESYEQARTLDDLDRAKIVSVSQIQPVITPEKPAKPKKLLVIVGGLLLGMLAAGGAIVVAVATNNSFMTAEGVERLLRLPVLVTVPRATVKNGGAGFVAG
jgi:polysaccharide biosynthesis protein PslE